MFALFLYLTLYLQSFLGYSPIEAGLRYLPITVASFVVAPLSGMALAKVQARYLMSGGLALTGVGLALMAGLDMHSDWTALLAGFLISGVGVGLLNPVIADVALSVVPKERERHGGGDQRHLPAGRDRGRDRRLGAIFQEPRAAQGDGRARRHPSGRARPPRSPRSRPGGARGGALCSTRRGTRS